VSFIGDRLVFPCGPSARWYRTIDAVSGSLYVGDVSFGRSFVVVGGVAALLLAMTAADHFWIANVIYLTFVLSAVLGSVAKIVAYRRGFQPW
jgi:hypothetical protein